jgi:hypothetical protein
MKDKKRAIIPRLVDDIRLINVSIQCIRQAMKNTEKKGIPVLSSSPMLLRFDTLIKRRYQKQQQINSMRRTHRKARALLTECGI